MMRFILAGLSFVLLSLLPACDWFEKKPEPEVQKLNPILDNAHFIDTLNAFTIKLVAPGSGTPLENIEKLQHLSLKIDIPPNLISEAIKFHSNTDEVRFELLKEALTNETAKAPVMIWGLRGGYGSLRLIDQLQTIAKPKTQKIFIGFSDITSLHLFLSQKWNWKTIHGAVLLELLSDKKDPANFQKLMEVVTGQHLKAEIHHLTPLNDLAKIDTQKSSKAGVSNVQMLTGRLTGGNLSIIQTSIGTHWQMDGKNKIVFLEDVGEKGYQLDRKLFHLKQAELFKGVKAIVFGDFHVDSDEYVDLALQRFANDIQIPVYKTDEFGHGVKNYPLIYGSNARIVKAKDQESYDLLMQ